MSWAIKEWPGNGSHHVHNDSDGMELKHHFALIVLRSNRWQDFIRSFIIKEIIPVRLAGAKLSLEGFIRYVPLWEESEGDSIEGNRFSRFLRDVDIDEEVTDPLVCGGMAAFLPILMRLPEWSGSLSYALAKLSLSRNYTTSKIRSHFQFPQNKKHMIAVC